MAMVVALGESPTENITRENYLFWKMRFIHALRCAQVVKLLKGCDLAPAETLDVEDAEKHKKTIQNPQYRDWIARDQHVMSYLIKSLSLNVLAHVVGLEHSDDLWAAIVGCYCGHVYLSIIFPDHHALGNLSNTKILI
jgi:hypothetical protein